jgi:hypothetical protein
MATRTWQVKILDRTLNLKMLKDDAKGFNSHVLWDLTHLGSYRRTLTGTLGVSEDSHECWIMFGASAPLSDECIAERDEIVKGLPETITNEDVPAIREKVKAWKNKYIPIVDERITPEEAAKDAAETAARRAKEDVELAEKKARGVEIQPGFMGIRLELNYDGSDIMSDYFAPHCTEKEWVVAVVPRQPETQVLARSIIARCPELAGVEFEWKSEKYSMGHGNYLIQRGGPRPKRENGNEGHWEITFSGRGLYEKHPAFSESPAFSQPAAGNGSITVQKNEVHNGVEVRFSDKPDLDTISSLKGQGFRWSFRQRLWYAKYTESRMEWAQKLAGTAA